jgi:hypothetical protein
MRGRRRDHQVEPSAIRSLATLRREIAGSLSILSPNVLPGGLPESDGAMASVAVDFIASPNFGRRGPKQEIRG